MILKPEPLPKLSTPTAVTSATSMLVRADADRGRTIFLARQGVGCAKCHRADGKGKSFGPDLRHLVQKRDPVHIVKSMLEPNAEIKEGFATQTIVTVAGKTFSGLLREETAEAGEPQDDLLNMEFMTSDLAHKLSRRGICTMEDLAEQSTDELEEIEGIDTEFAGKLIMKAREPWFAEAEAEQG